MKILAGVILAAVLGSAPALGAQITQLTASSLPAFRVSLEQSINQTDAAFKDLEDAKLPLLDEAGQTLGRRKIKDRRQVLVDIRETMKDFTRNPQDLVVVMTLSDQTEELADEVYDLSQIAYDNDREELAQNLTELLNKLNQDANLIASYAVDLATHQQQHVRQLEKENHKLREKRNAK